MTGQRPQTSCLQQPVLQIIDFLLLELHLLVFTIIFTGVSSLALMSICQQLHLVAPRHVGMMTW